MLNKQNNTKLLDYKLHLTVLVITAISLAIGTVIIPLTSNIKFILLPLIYSLVLAVFSYSNSIINWIDINQSKVSSLLMLLLIGPLVAKLSIMSGQNIDLLLTVGPILVLKEIGSLGTIILGLPIALLLGFKRESIGMTSSICREPQMAVLIEKYGLESDEVKGFFIVYLIGIILGIPFVILIVNILTSLLPLNPYSFALASGIGSSSLNVAITSSLTATFPELSSQIQAFSGISNLISLIFGIYLYIFISLPLTEKIYQYLQKYQR